MSHTQDDEERLAAALQRALDGEPGLPNEEEVALDEALAAAAFLKHQAAPPVLGPAGLADLAAELEAEVRAQLSREQEAADTLRQALDEGGPASEEAAPVLSAALYLHHAARPPVLGAAALDQLAAELVAEVGARAAEPASSAIEQRAASALAQLLQGEQPQLSEAERGPVERALATARFLQHARQAPRLGHETLTALGREVEGEARRRSAQRRRFALLSGASLLAVAASLLLLLRPGPRSEAPAARFPAPPRVTHEFQPGSDPLERLDPMYEAGLRGLREARFVGASYAYSSAK